MHMNICISTVAHERLMKLNKWKKWNSSTNCKREKIEHGKPFQKAQPRIANINNIIFDIINYSKEPFKMLEKVTWRTYAQFSLNRFLVLHFVEPEEQAKYLIELWNLNYPINFQYTNLCSITWSIGIREHKQFALWINPWHKFANIMRSITSRSNGTVINWWRLQYLLA